MKQRITLNGTCNKRDSQIIIMSDWKCTKFQELLAGVHHTVIYLLCWSECSRAANRSCWLPSNRIKLNSWIRFVYREVRDSEISKSPWYHVRLIRSSRVNHRQDFAIPNSYGLNQPFGEFHDKRLDIGWCYRFTHRGTIGIVFCRIQWIKLIVICSITSAVLINSNSII